MENFSTELKYRVVMLKDEGSIVLTSFVVQKSLSYLDLQLSEHILALRREHFVGTYCHPSFFLINFFSTEESLRNSLEPKRRLLYTLHLDVPQGKEYSNFINGPASSTFHESFESLHLVVSINNCFYSSVLSRLVETAFDRASDKFKLLKVLVDLDEEEDPPGLREDIGYFYLNHLYRECINSNFVMKCLRKIIYLTDLLKMEQPKLLEYFLYHACKSDFDLIKIFRWRESIANICIRESCFRSLQSVLKYEDKSCYSENSYNYYGSSVWNDRRNRTFDATSKPENQMSKTRLYRLLEILDIFDRREGVWVNHEQPPEPLDVVEALRLVWSSIPDAFVSLQEMQEAYGFALNSTEISDVHAYYEEAIRQTVSCREPRTLSQYCKITVRKILHKNNQWLPDGITQLNLPPKLQDYLNLQM